MTTERRRAIVRDLMARWRKRSGDGRPSWKVRRLLDDLHGPRNVVSVGQSTPVGHANVSVMGTIRVI
jgi:hypothetical protein